MIMTNMDPLSQVPLISGLQRINIYETFQRYYVVGSNNSQTRFRVLKIDRTEPRDLIITDDKMEYTQHEVRDLLIMIDVGNRTKHTQNKSGTYLPKTVSAFGIIGFVRFLEGYYIVLITKRRKVAVVGGHTIYKVEDSNMVYIPNDYVRYIHPDEQRYVKIFQTVDLSSNFYFSYSYDLTHSLQYNLTPCKSLSTLPCISTSPTCLNQSDTAHSPKVIENVKRTTETSENTIGDPKTNTCDAEDTCSKPKRISQCKSNRELVYGVWMEPTYRYVWNSHLLEPMEPQVHPEWTLYLIHGFIGQSNISIYGKPIYLTLIARRSNKFAGTRFLKRGANTEGYVANDVETEQIVHDASILSLDSGSYTSIIQHRGSVPLHWSQDISTIVPKPPISIDQTDPFGSIAGQHFNQMLSRYGSPIIVLNLVKKREKKKHESILTEEFVSVIKYLNQFLSEENAIKYIGFDMARVNKRKNSNVLHQLAEIAEYCVKSTGIFHSGPKLYCNKLRPHPRCKDMPGLSDDTECRQQGVVRTNCVDCLDRTNTAQFAIGKCALAFQLYALGVLDEPVLEFDTDCVRMLEELYEDHGDTLALQYGGSQLVHRIKGYRKISPWTSNSRDIMQTLSRYYSNTFSDADKQNALNLFLGIYKPKEGLPNQWEMPTDFYLHNDMDVSFRKRAYCQWWEAHVVDALPASCEEESKGKSDIRMVLKTRNDDEKVSAFLEYYKMNELTNYDQLYSIHLPCSTRDFMPKFSSNFSPFALRVAPGPRQQDFGQTLELNPNISGKDSSASVNSQGSDDYSSSGSDESDMDGDLQIQEESPVHFESKKPNIVSLKDLFPTMLNTYGITVEEPDRQSNKIYKRYCQIGTNATVPTKDKTKVYKGTHLVQKSAFPMDTSRKVEPPTVSQQSKDIYLAYLKKGRDGAGLPRMNDLKIYREYLSQKYM